MPFLSARAPLSTLNVSDTSNTTDSIIAGCVVGGVLALVLVGLLAWWLLRRALRARREDEERSKGGALGERVNGSVAHIGAGRLNSERKFIQLGETKSPSSLSATTHLPIATLPSSFDPAPPTMTEPRVLGSMSSATGSGVLGRTYHGRPVSASGVIGNANSLAYSPYNTRRPP